MWWTPTLIVLLAVVAAFGLASSPVSAQSSDSREVSKLVSSNTSSAIPASDAVQADKMTSLRTVDTITAENAEERVSPKLSAGLGAKLAKTTKGSLAMKSALMMPHSSHTLPYARVKGRTTKNLSLVGKIEIVKKFIYHMEKDADASTALNRLKATRTLSQKDLEFADDVFNFVSQTNIGDIKKQIKTYIQSDKHTEAGVIKHLMASEIKSKSSKLALVLFYYRDLSRESVKKRIARYLAGGVAEGQVIINMRNENGQKFMDGGLQHIREIIAECKSEESAKQYMPLVGEYLIDKYSPDETHALVTSLKGLYFQGDKKIIDISIKQWFEKNDPDMFKVLEEWVDMGERSRIVHELLLKRHKNPQMSLNTRDASSFNQKSYEPTSPVSKIYKEWLEECLQPSQIGKKKTGTDKRRFSGSAL